MQHLLGALPRSSAEQFHQALKSSSMPIGAQELRVRTGLINASRQLKVVHSRYGIPRCHSLGISLPPPTWMGWRALLLMLTLPQLYKITTVITVLGITLWSGHTKSGGYKVMDVSGDWNDCDGKISSLSVINHLSFDCSSLWTAPLACCALFLYIMILMKLVLIIEGANESCHSQELTVEYSRISIISILLDPSHDEKCKGQKGYHTTPAFQVCAAVLMAILLLSAKDVETIQKSPGKLTIKNTRSVLYPARTKWKDIGIELEVDMGTLNAIEERCRGDPDKCLPEVMDHWLKQSDPSPSWEALAEALESAPVGEGLLAEQIRQKYCTKSDAFTTSSSSGIQQLLTVPASVLKYSKHLKAMYNTSPVIPGNKWPPSPSTKYINLACINKQTVNRHEAGEFTKFTIHGNIDDICHKKTPMCIEQVACLVKHQVKGHVKELYPGIVLVEGAPGVGKTTLAWELCCRWAQGELLQHYSLVVLLRMRDNTAREARELVDLFPYPKKSLSESLVDEALEVSGKGILLVLEGFDELPEDKRTRDSSVYLQLIEGKLLPSSTVLITSRPWAVSRLGWRYSKSIDQRIEILGFTRQQIDEYLISYSNKDLKLLNNMRHYVSLNPPIHAAMYIPLNTVIVCEIYKDRQNSECVIPSTMTELYTAFSLTLLIRYLDDLEQISQKINKFEDLPPTVSEKFLAICKLASKGISNNQQLIFSDLPDGFDTLGFMQSVSELHVSSGVSVSYNFLHLTIQEFLAAYYLSVCPQSNPGLNIESDVKIKNSHDLSSLLPDSIPNELSSVDTIETFIAGITKMQDNNLNNQLPVHSIEQCTVKDHMNKSRSLTPISASLGSIFQTKTRVYAMKTQCHVFLKGTAPYCTWLYESQNLDVLHSCLGNKTAMIEITSDITPMQCFAAGWCIGKSNCEWKLYFTTMQALQLKCLEMLQAGIRHSRIGSKYRHRICELCISAEMMECDPTAQEIFFNLLDEYIDCIQIIHIFQDSYTIEYDPRVSYHRQLFCTYLSRMIRNAVHLKEVSLTINDFSDTISNCDDEEPDIVCDAKLCITNMYIEKLELVNFHLAGGEIMTLLRNSTNLKHLALVECKLNDMRSITEELQVNKSLRTIDLSGSRLEMCGGADFAEMLKRNQTLQVLKLYGCHLTQVETTSLFQVFTANQNTTLHTLHIGNNWFHIKHLEEMISSNSSLRCLEITMTYADIKQKKYQPTFTKCINVISKQWGSSPNMVGTFVDDYQRSSADSELESELQFAYVDDTLGTFCQMIVSAMDKNTTLQHLVIHTKLSETKFWLKLRRYYHDCDEVKDRIQVVQSIPCAVRNCDIV